MILDVPAIRELDRAQREVFRQIARLVLPRWTDSPSGFCMLCHRGTILLQRSQALPDEGLCMHCMRVVLRSTGGSSTVDRSKNVQIYIDISTARQNLVIAHNTAVDLLAYVVTCTNIICETPYKYDGVGGCDTCLRNDKLAFAQ